MKRGRGFLLVTVLLVLLVVTALGVVMLGSTMQNTGYVRHEIAQVRAEEMARSGLAYYQAHGVPPLVNGKPQKLRVFPEKNWSLEIEREGDVLTLTGTLGSEGRASYRVPLWDLRDFEHAR